MAEGQCEIDSAGRCCRNQHREGLECQTKELEMLSYRSQIDDKVLQSRKRHGRRDWVASLAAMGLIDWRHKTEAKNQTGSWLWK